MKFRKVILITAIAVLASFSLIGCSGSGKSKQELNLYTWAEYVPADVIADFEDETGIKVNYSNFETNEEMLAKLENTKGGDYDLVIASDYIINLAVQEGLVAELDKSKIPNFKNIDSKYQGFFYDSDNKYTVPYAPGIPLIVYNPDNVKIDITGYESMWDPSLKDSVGIMDTERVINGIALKVLGDSFNTEDLGEIQKAGDKLLELAPNIRILSQDQTQDYLVSGEINVAFLFTSQVAMALQANPDLKVVYPKEGLGFGVDALFIPSKAPNMDNAHKFLDFILQGEEGAKISSQIYYLCPNKAAYDFLPEDFQKSLVISTDDIPNGEFIQDVSPEATELHNKIYTEFKSKLN